MDIETDNAAVFATNMVSNDNGVCQACGRCGPPALVKKESEMQTDERSLTLNAYCQANPSVVECGTDPDIAVCNSEVQTLDVVCSDKGIETDVVLSKGAGMQTEKVDVVDGGMQTEYVLKCTTSSQTGAEYSKEISTQTEDVDFMREILQKVTNLERNTISPMQQSPSNQLLYLRQLGMDPNIVPQGYFPPMTPNIKAMFQLQLRIKQWLIIGSLLRSKKI
ncbi:unnamed protein product [Caenorhabditis bovis]|nr:unnamed protein product [Caenorhabditis bovis]